MKEILNSIVNKYRELATKTLQFDDEKANKYERFADFIEDNMDEFIESYSNKDYEDYEESEIEKELLEIFNEQEGEIDAQRDSMFPEGDEDDSITDWLTD